MAFNEHLRARPRTALVLSAGGMFGAYQAGVWKVLSEAIQPDLVVGSSIGALNGWAIASGCPPGELIEHWLNLDALSNFRWRVPSSPWQGILDSSAVEELVQSVYSRFQPKIEYGVVITDTLRLRPILCRQPGLTWRHLAASTAMLGFFSQHKIAGRVYSDGGLRGALPVWAAAEMGAEHIVAINVLPELPGLVVKNFCRALQGIARFDPAIPESVRVTRITAPVGMGSVKDALYWKRDNVRRWIDQGERDAAAAIANGLLEQEVAR